MTPAGGILRVTVVVACAGAMVGIATTTTGSLELARTGTGAGLPAVSAAAVTDATLVCPGPERIGVDGLRDVPARTRVTALAAPQAVVSGVVGAGRGAVRVGPLEATTGATVAQRARPVQVTVSRAQGAVVRATGALAPGVVGVQTWLRRGDDDRGLAMSPCSPPAADLWLVGGGSGPSRTERLVLTNPGANTVMVAFTVLGADGTIAGTGHDRTIPPRSRSVLSLDTLAPGVSGPVVHVVATGGEVSGVLSDAWIDGATARGIDDAVAVAPPGRDLVVAGIDKAGAASLRIGNPSGQEAVVQLRVLTRAGPVQPDGLRALRVPAGATLDVPLDVPDGAVGVHVVADQPVVAAAWVERRVATGTDRMGDFGWVPATPAVQRLAGLALPGAVVPGATARLLLAAGRARSVVTVTTSGPDSQTRRVDVPADKVVTVDLGRAEGVWVAPSAGPLHAAVSVAGVVDKVPVLSIVPLTDTPLTAVTVPVRQVGS
ncbi:DUF5719 family protein [Intrasporangium sp.]|uniref:DUF5719 family protein n=1 Tax=Intrasporangium sp. TaxID=1925024 RepID=UPI0032221933